MSKKLNIKVEPEGEGFKYIGPIEDLKEMIRRYYEFLEELGLDEEDKLLS